MARASFLLSSLLLVSPARELTGVLLRDSYYGDDLGTLRNGTAQARLRMRRRSQLAAAPISA